MKSPPELAYSNLELASVLRKPNPVCFNFESAFHYPQWLAYQAAFAKLDASRVHLAILGDKSRYLLHHKTGAIFRRYAR